MASAELPKKVALKWREWSNYPEFAAGLQWLLANHAPRTSDAKSDTELVKSAVGWNAYKNALDDVEERLTKLPAPQATIDEAPLNTVTTSEE